MSKDKNKKKELTPEQKKVLKESSLSNFNNENLTGLAAISFIDNDDPRFRDNYGSITKDIVWKYMPSILSTKVNFFGQEKNLLQYIKGSKDFQEIFKDEIKTKEEIKVPENYTIAQVKGLIFGAFNNVCVGEVLKKIEAEDIELTEDIKSKSMSELKEDKKYSKAFGILQSTYLDSLQNKALSQGFEKESEEMAGGLEGILTAVQDNISGKKEASDEEKAKEKELAKQKEENRKIALFNLKSDRVTRRISMYGEIASNPEGYGKGLKEKVEDFVYSLVDNELTCKNFADGKKISVEQINREKTKMQGYTRGATSIEGIAKDCKMITEQSVYRLKVEDIISEMGAKLSKDTVKKLGDNVKGAYISDLLAEENSNELKTAASQLVTSYMTYITYKEMPDAIKTYGENQKNFIKSQLEASGMTKKAPDAASNQDYTLNAGQATA